MADKKYDREGKQDPQIFEGHRGSIKNILHRFHIKQHPDPGQLNNHGANQEWIWEQSHTESRKFPASQGPDIRELAAYRPKHGHGHSLAVQIGISKINHTVLPAI